MRKRARPVISVRQDRINSLRVLEERGTTVDTPPFISRHGSSSRFRVVHPIVIVRSEVLGEIILVRFRVDFLCGARSESGVRERGQQTRIRGGGERDLLVDR